MNNITKGLTHHLPLIKAVWAIFFLVMTRDFIITGISVNLNYREKEQKFILMHNLATKIELSQENRVFILRPNLHQSLNFPLLYCMLGKKLVHKLFKVIQILQILQWLCYHGFHRSQNPWSPCYRCHCQSWLILECLWTNFYPAVLSYNTVAGNSNSDANWTLV